MSLVAAARAACITRDGGRNFWASLQTQSLSVYKQIGVPQACHPTTIFSASAIQAILAPASWQAVSCWQA